MHYLSPLPLISSSFALFCTLLKFGEHHFFVQWRARARAVHVIRYAFDLYFFVGLLQYYSGICLSWALN